MALPRLIAGSSDRAGPTQLAAWILGRGDAPDLTSWATNPDLAWSSHDLGHNCAKVGLVSHSPSPRQYFVCHGW